MKNLLNRSVKKILLWAAYIFIPLAAFLLLIDLVILPWYVDEPTLQVPDVVGQQQEFAMENLKENNLNPIIESTRYDKDFAEGAVIYQKPSAGSTVKVNRRVYLVISGGNPLIQIPDLEGKTLRDAKLSAERLGLAIGEIIEKRSEFPADIVVDQSIESGENVESGTLIDLTVSIGPRVGMIRVPNILGKPLNSAKRLLIENSLRLGKIEYQTSDKLLPNTVLAQNPVENTLLPASDSVDVVISRTK